MTIVTTMAGERFVPTMTLLPVELKAEAKALGIGFSSTLREALAEKIEDQRRAHAANAMPAPDYHRRKTEAVQDERET